MSASFDYKKAYKELYRPKEKPVLVDVPEMTFIMIDGSGAPDDEKYQSAIKTLYSLSYTIKMSHKKGQAPEGFFQYVVPPLESLWWSKNGKLDPTMPKSDWLWTAMIRQPEFVTPEVFRWAVEECKKKKPPVDVSRARLDSFKEGLCVQILHVGPYHEEHRSTALLEEYIAENGLTNLVGKEHKHHEIYLSDPNRTAPEKLKTVIRFPVSR